MKLTDTELEFLAKLAREPNWISAKAIRHDLAMDSRRFANMFIRLASLGFGVMMRGSHMTREICLNRRGWRRSRLYVKAYLDREDKAVA